MLSRIISPLQNYQKGCGIIIVGFQPTVRVDPSLHIYIRPPVIMVGSGLRAPTPPLFHPPALVLSGRCLIVSAMPWHCYALYTDNPLSYIDTAMRSQYSWGRSSGKISLGNTVNSTTFNINALQSFPQQPWNIARHHRHLHPCALESLDLHLGRPLSPGYDRPRMTHGLALRC